MRKTNEILAQIQHQAFPRTATCDFANVSSVMYGKMI